jgi:predicted HicB family RNase H-like nuclease
MDRKRLSDSLKKPIETQSNTTDLIINTIENTSEKKLTVMLPNHLHHKLKVYAAQNHLSIKEIIVNFLEKL